MIKRQPPIPAVLPYGAGSLPLPHSIPAFSLLKPLLPPVIENPQDYIAHAIDNPLNAKTFNEFITPRSKVVIIIPDITRATLSELYLPIIINRLYHLGINHEDITLLSALGIHRAQTADEHKKLVGAHLYEQLKVIDHDAFDYDLMVHLGTTRRGTPIEVNHLLTEADHIILTGSIRFHYFAGFGGGRKGILPGTASFRACVANHLLVLNPPPHRGRHPRVRTGMLEGNPVHEDMVEACTYFPSLFLVNTILSPQQQLLEVVAGNIHTAFAQGCQFLSHYFSIPIAHQADLVMVSCGGNPWDLNFIQAHKTMDMAASALREGGVMILLAECAQGLGNSRFLEWFTHESAERFEHALRLNYQINGQTAYATFLKAQKYHIILISSLPPDTVTRISLTPASTIEEALEYAYRLVGPHPTAYLIPQGSSVLPTPVSP